MLVLTRLSRYIYTNNYKCTFQIKSNVFYNTTYNVIHSMLNYMFVGVLILRNYNRFVWELIIFDNYQLYVHYYQNDKYETYIFRHKRGNTYIDF